MKSWQVTDQTPANLCLLAKSNDVYYVDISPSKSIKCENVGTDSGSRSDRDCSTEREGRVRAAKCFGFY